ncbi:MAG: hypothetical protein JWM77_559 [Rhodospirillales bacterium]|nr:hypothetical protein [Rhodospirillales bacterium]
MAPDSGGLIEFDVRTPLDNTILREHVQAALSRGLPEVEAAPRPKKKRLRIIANGPSALSAPLTGAPTLAVNNALRLFVERGLAPDYWIASDPQSCVADFLCDAPRETTYLVASKCHPSVFDVLQERRVVLWHCAEQATLDLFVGRLVVPTSVSVTLCALNLMPVLGFERIETWGWDGCYMTGRDHAVAQPHRRDDVTIQLGPRRRFATTTSWAAEAEDAVHLFKSAERQVRIRGRGMIGAILRQYALA